MLTQLIPGLFIGSWHDARDSEGYYIVTVASDSQFIGDLHYKLVDGPGNHQTTFRAAVEAVCSVHKAGNKVLVHCVGGRSRSAAVVVAAATKITGRPLCEIYDELIRKHDLTGAGARIHPHLSLLLLEYE